MAQMPGRSVWCVLEDPGKAERRQAETAEGG